MQLERYDKLRKEAKESRDTIGQLLERGASTDLKMRPERLESFKWKRS